VSLSERVARGVKASLIARVVYIATNSALLIVLTRYLLEPGEYGQLYFALSILGIALLFSALGIPGRPPATSPSTPRRTSARYRT